MASVDEIVTALQGAIDELNDCISATSTAESGTDDMISLQSAAGVQDEAANLVRAAGG